jgi:hypothetical protein
VLLLVIIHDDCTAITADDPEIIGTIIIRCRLLRGCSSDLLKPFCSIIVQCAITIV